jgi:hypothetical protein
MPLGCTSNTRSGIDMCSRVHAPVRLTLTVQRRTLVLATSAISKGGPHMPAFLADSPRTSGVTNTGESVPGEPHLATAISTV